MKETDPVKSLIRAFKTLPQVGDKTALKYVQAIVRGKQNEARNLAKALLDVASSVHECVLCGNFATGDLCEVCADPNRDKSVVCVVEGLEDLLALETAGGFQGVYHLLGGLVNPIRGIGPKELRLQALGERVARGAVNEVILALPPTTEGEFTVHYVMEMFQGAASVTLSRMAMGVPYGAQISFLDAKTLKAALEHRIGVCLPNSPALNARG